MRRKFLIAVLALGTVGGFASGFASLRHCNMQRRDSFEQHVAQVCVDAARKEEAASARAQAPQPQQPSQYGYGGPPVIVQVNPPAAAVAPAAAPAAPPAQ